MTTLSFMGPCLKRIQYEYSTVKVKTMIVCVFLIFLDSSHSRFSFTFFLFAVARVSSSIIDPHPRVRTLGLSALSGRHTCEFMIFKLVERADGANMSVETPHQPLHRADPPRRSTANKDPSQQHKSGRHRSDDERAATLIGIRVGERSVPLVVITQSGRTGMGLWSRRRVGWGVYGWRRR